jgi:hypothetical protein
MLIVKLTERDDGTIIAETPRAVLARFNGERREDVIAFLEHKAREINEELRIVEDFNDTDPNARLGERDFRHMMKRHF